MFFIKWDVDVGTGLHERVMRSFPADTLNASAVSSGGSSRDRASVACCMCLQDE
jgi:hypothetical protein